MSSDPNPKIIEELKAAGKELKRAILPERIRKEKKEKTKPSPAKMVEEEKIDFFGKLAEYQRELNRRLTQLQGTYQKVKGLEKKLRRRMESLQALQSKSAKIKNEWKEFRDQFALAKKESNNFLKELENLKEK